MNSSRFFSDESSPKNSILLSISPKSRLDIKAGFPLLDKSPCLRRVTRFRTHKEILTQGILKPNNNLIKQELIEILCKLKPNLNKINRAKIACEAIEHFMSSSDVFFKQFNSIFNEVQNAIFCDNSTLEPTIKTWIYEKYDSIAADFDSQIPYFCVAEALQFFYDNERHRYSELLEEVYSLKNTIKELNNQILEFQSVKQEKLSLKEELKLKLNELEQSKNKANYSKLSSKSKIDKLADEMHYLYENLSAKEAIINKKDSEIKVKNEENYELSLSKAKYKEFCDKSNEEKLRVMEFNDVLMKKVKELKAQNNEFEKKLTEAETKNNALSVRAAGGFENLTPRPNFGDLEPFLESHTNDKTTKGKVKYLVASYIHINNNRKKTKKLIRKDYADSLQKSREKF